MRSIAVGRDAFIDRDITNKAGKTMRGLILTSSVVLMLSFATSFAGAGPRVIAVEPAATEVPPGFETYRGYIYDLSENVDRKDKGAIVDLLKKQIDVVESVGLSPKVLQFFHTVPIIASEMGCTEIGAAIACYGSIPPETSARNRTFTVWDSSTMSWSNPNFVDLAADAGTGVIKLRPNMLKYAEDPVILHELLHAYHAKLMAGGLENLGIKAMYAQAVSKNVLPKDEYAMANPQEFFAVTASVFLAGKGSLHEPHTRAQLKEKMPKYYKFLVELFGFDPEPSTTPVADSAKPAEAAATAPADGT
jgi:hypothetical protein